MSKLALLGGKAEEFPYLVIAAAQTATETIPVRPEYSFTDRLQLALFHRPRWTQSLTMIESDPCHMQVTYSDDPQGEHLMIAVSDGGVYWKERKA